ncbi:hypothetical protein MKX03_018252 [Papaver bracteatum]|nr:hypothetical protein MKX03_018252 [Papaver bracteatum]
MTLNNGGGKMMHIVMYHWFAMGHLTAFLHTSNKLATKGHRVSLLIPTKTQSKLNLFNLHPALISFIPLDVPPIDGLPYDAETTADVLFPLHTHFMTAMDRIDTTIESILLVLKPDLIFFDFTHWIPAIGLRLGIKSINYCIISPARILEYPPSSFPPSEVKVRSYEVPAMASLTNCDVMAFKACKDMEGPFCDYLERQFIKPILLSGPIILETPTSTLDEKCQSNLNKHQFLDLVLALESTGLPFLAALKPPTGYNSAEEGGWVQQQLILSHPFIRYFVTHCGSLVMGENDEVANEVRLNHAKWKEFLLKDNLESSYNEKFITKLQDMLE